MRSNLAQRPAHSSIAAHHVWYAAGGVNSKAPAGAKLSRQPSSSDNESQVAQRFIGFASQSRDRRASQGEPHSHARNGRSEVQHGRPARRPPRREPHDRDRKSTRLNSSHVKISYAVFCLKKKKNNRSRFLSKKKKKKQPASKMNETIF